MTSLTVSRIVLRSLFCKFLGPEVEISGIAEGVVVRWRCKCGLTHEAKV